MPDPVIFLSAASVDLKPWREHLHTAFERAGFRVLTQDRSLRSAPGDVKRLLSETIEEATCVIHLAGLGYGSHATAPFPGHPAFQCSWTQFEYYHAHQQGKDVIAFVCAPDLSTPGFTEEHASPAELALKQRLQREHRQRVATGEFTGTPLEGKTPRTCNEAAHTPGKLLESVAAAVGTLRSLDLQDRERAQRELRSLAGSLAGVHRKLTAALVLLALVGLGVFWIKRDTAPLPAAVAQVGEGQEQLAAQMSQVQEALARIQQQTDPAKDPVSQWPQERLETALAEQLQMKVDDLRALLVAGRTSLDALVAGQALLATGQSEDAGKKFDLVLQQEQAAADRMRQAFAGKAQIAFDAVRYTEALDYYQKAAALVDKTADPLAWAEAQHGVAFVLDKLARYKEAEPLMREVVRIWEEKLGPDDPKLATALNNLALLLQATNRLSEAEPLMERVVKILENPGGEPLPNYAAALNNLAQLLKATNRLSEAEPLMRRALRIDEASLGPDHPDVARDLNNLALLLQATNRLSEAEPLLERVVKIFEASHGKEHPNVATALNNLAQLLQATNRLSEAEPLMERVVKIFEASHGKEHPNVATALNNLALLLQATNRLSEAELLMRRALRIDEASLGPDHPDVARDLNNLAQLLQDTNRLSEAEPLLERVVKILENPGGEPLPNYAAALNNLAQLLKATNRLSEAEPLMRRALRIDEASLGPDHPDVARDLNNLARLLQDTNRLGEAEPLMRRAVGISLRFRRATGHEHPSFRLRTENYLGILADLQLPAAEQRARLEALAGELGLEKAEVMAQFALILGPFDVTVTEVVPEGQGPALGILAGDIIRRYNGEVITQAGQVVKLTGETREGAIPLEIQRGGETLRLTAKPGRLGLRLEDKPQAAAP